MEDGNREIFGRCTGETTRRADKYVQELYNNKGKWVYIKDHHNTQSANRDLFSLISSRVSREHSQDRFSFDLLGMRIKLLEDMRDGIQREKQVELELLHNYENNHDKTENKMPLIY